MNIGGTLSDLKDSNVFGVSRSEILVSCEIDSRHSLLLELVAQIKNLS